MTKAKRKPKKAEPIQIAQPTNEQLAQGEFRRVGMSFRRVPVIETLYAEHKLTSRQFNGLARSGNFKSAATARRNGIKAAQAEG